MRSNSDVCRRVSIIARGNRSNPTSIAIRRGCVKIRGLARESLAPEITLLVVHSVKKEIVAKFLWLAELGKQNEKYLLHDITNVEVLSPKAQVFLALLCRIRKYRYTLEELILRTRMSLPLFSFCLASNLANLPIFKAHLLRVLYEQSLISTREE